MQNFYLALKIYKENHACFQAGVKTLIPASYGASTSLPLIRPSPYIDDSN